MDTMEHATRKKVTAASCCAQAEGADGLHAPGASVARVAQSHGLNANMVHAWRQQERMASTPQSKSTPAPAPQFIELPLPANAASALPDIRIEARRGATMVSLSWPGQAASQCGAWLQEWLR
jgi:transposase